jgi:predicted nucleic acid-binding protein
MHVTWQSSQALVIDANVAVWAVVPLMQDKEVDAFSRVRNWQVEGLTLTAPVLWLAEATSSIRRAVYSKLLSDENGRRAIEQLFALEIKTASLSEALCKAAFDWATKLGQARAYDGFYMALANTLGVEFWTADRRLVNGARQAGVSWVRWIGEN